MLWTLCPLTYVFGFSTTLACGRVPNILLQRADLEKLHLEQGGSIPI